MLLSGEASEIIALSLHLLEGVIMESINAVIKLLNQAIVNILA